MCRGHDGVRATTVSSSHRYVRYNCVLKHPKITEELYADFARRMTGDLPGYNYPKIGALLDKVGTCRICLFY